MLSVIEIIFFSTQLSSTIHIHILPLLHKHVVHNTCGIPSDQCIVMLPIAQCDKNCHLIKCIHSCSLANEHLHHIRLTKMCCIMKWCDAKLHIQTLKASNVAPLTKYNMSQSRGLGATSVEIVKWIYPWRLHFQNCTKAFATLTLSSKQVFPRELLCQNYNLLMWYCSCHRIPLISTNWGLCTNPQYL